MVLRQSERRHDSVAHVVHDDAVVSRNLPLDERLHLVQEIARPFRPQRLRDPGEPRKVDEHHGDVLPDRLLQEFGLAQHVFEERRRLKSGQRGLFGGGASARAALGDEPSARVAERQGRFEASGVATLSQ